MDHFGVTKSRALKIKPFTIFTWTIMHLVFPPKFYVTTHCLQFFLGIKSSQEEWKTLVIQIGYEIFATLKFGDVNVTQKNVSRT